MAPSNATRGVRTLDTHIEVDLPSYYNYTHIYRVDGHTVRLHFHVSNIPELCLGVAEVLTPHLIWTRLADDRSWKRTVTSPNRLHGTDPAHELTAPADRLLARARSILQAHT